MHPIVSMRDKSFICTDDPDCQFQTCDPASLLRHRKRWHSYMPRLSNDHKIGESSSSPQVIPPTTLLSPPSTLPGLPPYFFPETTSYLPEILNEFTSIDSFNSPLLFPGSPPPCNYAWDSNMSHLSEIGFFNFLTAEPDTEQSTTSGQH